MTAQLSHTGSASSVKIPFMVRANGCNMQDCTEFIASSNACSISPFPNPNHGWPRKDHFGSTHSTRIPAHFQSWIDTVRSLEVCLAISWSHPLHSSSMASCYRSISPLREVLTFLSWIHSFQFLKSSWLPPTWNLSREPDLAVQNTASRCTCSRLFVAISIFGNRKTLSLSYFSQCPTISSQISTKPRAQICACNIGWFFMICDHQLPKTSHSVPNRSTRVLNIPKSPCFTIVACCLSVIGSSLESKTKLWPISISHPNRL